jgi:hypothetical protein
MSLISQSVISLQFSLFPKEMEAKYYKKRAILEMTFPSFGEKESSGAKSKNLTRESMDLNSMDLWDLELGQNTVYSLKLI